MQDVRIAARLLFKDGRFTLVAVLALALGVGANNTLFTVVNAMCLRGLPIDGIARFIDVSNHDSSGRPMPLSPHQFHDLVEAHPASVDAFAGYVTRPATLRDDQSAAERMSIAYVTANALSLMGQQPVIGRGLTDEDTRSGATPVAILAADLWRSRYGADAGVVGRSVTIDGVPVSIVGIMPDRFRFPDNAQIWRPLTAFPAGLETPTFTVYGRLAARGTIAQARETIAAALAHSPAPATGATPLRTVTVPLNDRYVGDITNPAWIVFITVGVLLVVIACSNVANLLLARGARRGKEMAIRLSLGATRLRIVRQLLVESAMLAGLGGLGAVLVSAIGNRLLWSMIPADALPYWISLTMDRTVAAVLAAVCLGAVLLFGLAPALHLARTSASTVLKETSGGTSHDRRAARWTWFFLSCQLALTVMLLSKLDFTVRSYFASVSRDPIVDAKQVLTFGIALPGDTYGEPERRLAFYRALAARLVATGRASLVSTASALPFAGAMRTFAPEGQRVDDSSPRVQTAAVDATYFRALGIDVIEGRPFTDPLTAADRHSIVVNQRFAELFLARRTAVGQRVRIGATGSGSSEPELRTIVGVVPSLREDSRREAEPAAYLPLAADATPSVVVIVRTKGDASLLAPIVREEIRRLDAGVPVSRLMTLATVNWNAHWNPRVASRIVITLALIALALATVGLAALTAYAVSARRRELGIRLALGATGAGVVRLVLQRVVRQALAGVVLGTIAAKIWDPTIATITLAAVSLLVLTLVIATSAWPAARAARLDPLRTLRDA